MEKQDLINFENRIKQLWEEAKIHSPVHISGGNEEFLIRIFQEIKPGDYVFSSHRSHYHYLLAGGLLFGTRLLAMYLDSFASMP